MNAGFKCRLNRMKVDKSSNNALEVILLGPGLILKDKDTRSIQDFKNACFTSLYLLSLVKELSTFSLISKINPNQFLVPFVPSLDNETLNTSKLPKIFADFFKEQFSIILVFVFRLSINFMLYGKVLRWLNDFFLKFASWMKTFVIIWWSFRKSYWS